MSKTEIARRWVVLLFAFLLSSSVGVAAQAPEPEQLGRKAGSGEQCVVCGMMIHDAEVVEIRYKGRTFHVGAPFLERFLAEPERYFHKLQAPALFDPFGANTGAVGYGWLWLGLWVVAGLVCAALCGYLAVGRGLRPLPWFFAGLLGNVAALLLLVVTSTRTEPVAVPTGLYKVPTTALPRRCAACGHENHPAARACIGCRVVLEPAFESEAQRLRTHPRRGGVS